MEAIQGIIDILLHIDKHLNVIIQDYQVWTYLILFIVIFAETGFVVTPFLPGDPLLFAAGALIAAGGTGLDIYMLTLILSVAAIAGNFVNYTIGGFLGTRIFKPTNKILKPEYYESTKEFFKKHGGKAVIFSRFFPIFRTFVPFVAGVGKMRFRLFALYNITGGIFWIVTFLFLGYLFGNITIVKENFSIVIIAITILSSTPPIIAAVRSRIKKAKPVVPADEAPFAVVPVTTSEQKMGEDVQS
ncbi:DedA family protein [Pedobacter sp. SYSU D00535]|uniref:DedA family protein n=1 Tax=Pedobacter sp. SYSU D00535 TaxID=2810308 RepID=UPI001A973439|nr:DedA family protein [Pedobacter sp. SYSU D00535]